MSEYANVQVAVQSAELKSVSFKNGKDIAWLAYMNDPIGRAIRGDAVCGGYYK